MSTLYVLAPDALIDVTDSCQDAGAVQRLIAALNDLVADSTITFTHDTPTVCKNYASGEAITNWVVSAAGNLGDTQPPWDAIEDVLSDCAELLAEDEAADVQVAVSVLALAVNRGSTISDVCVVTNEVVDGPGTISLATACARLAIARISLHDFVRAIGQSEVLASAA